MLYKDKEKQCVVCGGVRGYIRNYPEYEAHPVCYQRVPVEYVRWFMGVQHAVK
uniref:Uncharacterized protein n=1 Tax=viral metagenome TaxID=1070528 RepID=A0A6M3KUE3_9ZZZZ